MERAPREETPRPLPELEVREHALEGRAALGRQLLREEEPGVERAVLEEDPAHAADEGVERLPAEVPERDRRRDERRRGVEADAPRGVERAHARDLGVEGEGRGVPARSEAKRRDLDPSLREIERRVLAVVAEVQGEVLDPGAVEVDGERRPRRDGSRLPGDEPEPEHGDAPRRGTRDEDAGPVEHRAVEREPAREVGEVEIQRPPVEAHELRRPVGAREVAHEEARAGRLSDERRRLDVGAHLAARELRHETRGREVGLERPERDALGVEVAEDDGRARRGDDPAHEVERGDGILDLRVELEGRRPVEGRRAAQALVVEVALAEARVEAAHAEARRRLDRRVVEGDRRARHVHLAPVDVERETGRWGGRDARPTGEARPGHEPETERLGRAGSEPRHVGSRAVDRDGPELATSRTDGASLEVETVEAGELVTARGEREPGDGDVHRVEQGLVRAPGRLEVGLEPPVLERGLEPRALEVGSERARRDVERDERARERGRGRVRDDRGIDRELADLGASLRAPGRRGPLRGDQPSHLEQGRRARRDRGRRDVEGDPAHRDRALLEHELERRRERAVHERSLEVGEHHAPDLEAADERPLARARRERRGGDLPRAEPGERERSAGLALDPHARLLDRTRREGEPPRVRVEGGLGRDARDPGALRAVREREPLERGGEEEVVALLDLRGVELRREDPVRERELETAEREPRSEGIEREPARVDREGRGPRRRERDDRPRDADRPDAPVHAEAHLEPGRGIEPLLVVDEVAHAHLDVASSEHDGRLGRLVREAERPAVDRHLVHDDAGEVERGPGQSLDRRVVAERDRDPREGDRVVAREREREPRAVDRDRADLDLVPRELPRRGDEAVEADLLRVEVCLGVVDREVGGEPRALEELPPQDEPGRQVERDVLRLRDDVGREVGGELARVPLELELELHAPRVAFLVGVRVEVERVENPGGGEPHPDARRERARRAVQCEVVGARRELERLAQGRRRREVLPREAAVRHAHGLEDDARRLPARRRGVARVRGQELLELAERGHAPVRLAAELELRVLEDGAVDDDRGELAQAHVELDAAHRRDRLPAGGRELEVLEDDLAREEAQGRAPDAALEAEELAARDVESEVEREGNDEAQGEEENESHDEPAPELRRVGPQARGDAHAGRHERAETREERARGAGRGRERGTGRRRGRDGSERCHRRPGGLERPLVEPLREGDVVLPRRGHERRRVRGTRGGARRIDRIAERRWSRLSRRLRRREVATAVGELLEALSARERRARRGRGTLGPRLRLGGITAAFGALVVRGRPARRRGRVLRHRRSSSMRATISRRFTAAVLGSMAASSAT